MSDINIFYETQYEFYKEKYWSTNHKNIFIPNGFASYPKIIYSYFYKIIKSKIRETPCRILDIGCGNGLLLKHLIENSKGKIIIPYGIDFQERSIQQAKEFIHPIYNENFILQNAVNFNFSQTKFDIILIAPSHYYTKDFSFLMNKMLDNVKNTILFYCYSDVLNKMNYKSISDFGRLNSLGLKIYNYPEISIGTYEKIHTFSTVYTPIERSE